MIKKIYFALIFLGAIGVGIIIFLPVSFKSQEVYVYVEKGAGTMDIASQLAEKKLIRNKQLFFILAKFKTLKYGEYKLNRNKNMYEIMNLLGKGGTLYHTITVPEGYTSFQIAELLEERGLIKKEEFLICVNDPEGCGINFGEIKNLEGYLFPDTYFIKREKGAPAIIEMMLNRFKEVVPKEIDQRAKNLKLTPYQVIILASLVEKEAKVPEERSLIASVFLNRYRKKMRLESCSTVQYALGYGKYRRLSYNDLKISSPYNTYLTHKFPPTPISNPGRAAIYAAMYPESTNFLFFVHRGDGTHIFTNTYQEHIKAKEKVKKY